MKKRILVTGGAGMIGSNLCAKLLKEGHEVVAIDNLWRGKLKNLKEVCGDNYHKLKFYKADLSKSGEWTSLFNNIDCVYHLADVVAGIGFVFNNESYIFNENLLINSNVEKVVREKSIPRYIYVGTACSFPKELQHGVEAKPLEECDQFPADPESSYGWSKLMGELGAKFISKSSKTDSVVLVFHNVYGSPCDYSSETSQVIPSLIRRALEKKEGEFVVWGDGSQGRAFVHISDVVKALYKALFKGENCGPIQIGPDTCTSIKELAEIINNDFGNAFEIVFDKSKPSGDKGRCANYSKAKSILNWEPEKKLEKGISDLIDWIKKDLKK